MNEQNETYDDKLPNEDALDAAAGGPRADDVDDEGDDALPAWEMVGREEFEAHDALLAAEIDVEEVDAPVDDSETEGEGAPEAEEEASFTADADAVLIHDADAEDAEELRLASEAAALVEAVQTVGDDEVAPGGVVREMAELMAIVEALIFVSDEPLTAKAMAEVLGEERGWIEMAVEELSKEFNERQGGLMLREVAGGWQFATRPEHHEHVRAFLKSRPSAKLSLAALETLAVIAYKQPVTIPEILEIRGVQSSAAIKTLLDKRLIVAKGRKETVGRPMMYGTSKDFLMQFGLRDLSELPSIEDFEDLAGSVA
ncbi:MAG TPA: SMC-Scp complex subunit ScpB [Pyrinomonadaceae bacterium]|nr:SMC-Scp complex subunit ScpB [Pyrinomonadaceae bacterium]